MSEQERRLEAETSQAATTPLAHHQDELAPDVALRESSASPSGQRLGDNGPVANPITSFPDEGEEGDR